MATSASIARRLPDGRYRWVTLHWDGYPSHALKILRDHYNTEERIDQLLDLGALSVIGPKLEAPEGQQHTFDNPVRDVCIAYGRDRGEEDQEAEVTYYRPKYGAYTYVFENGSWGDDEESDDE